MCYHKQATRPQFSVHQHRIDAKQTWLVCQGFSFEDIPSVFDAADGRDDPKRKLAESASGEFRLFCKIAYEFLSCDQHLMNGVIIRFV